MSIEVTVRAGCGCVIDLRAARDFISEAIEIDDVWITSPCEQHRPAPSQPEDAELADLLRRLDDLAAHRNDDHGIALDAAEAIEGLRSAPSQPEGEVLTFEPLTPDESRWMDTMRYIGKVEADMWALEARIEARLRALEAAGNGDACEWSDDGDYWQTGCDNAWEFTTGGPHENGVKFCPYCGRGVAEVVPETKEERWTPETLS